MKMFVCVVLCGLLAVTTAEPPRFRPSRFRSRVLSRQELSPPEDTPPEDTPYPPASSPQPAPYPPSGVTPDNPLILPTETTPAPQYGAPAQAYGPPSSTYGPPTQEYGTPDQSYGTPQAEDPAANPESETIPPVATNGRLRSAYLLLVDPATLQRVQIAPQSSLRAPAKFRSRF